MSPTSYQTAPPRTSILTQGGSAVNDSVFASGFGPSAILLAEVFSRHHRKVRVLFGLSDVLLTALAFEAAYQTRLHLSLEKAFFLDPTFHLLLGGGRGRLTWRWASGPKSMTGWTPAIPSSSCAIPSASACWAPPRVVLFQYLLRQDP